VFATGLPATAMAIAIGDDVTQHHDQHYLNFRSLWQQENYCILLGCDKKHPVQILGGFGAAGGPNDHWHNHWRVLRRAYLRCAAGSNENPAFRAKLQDLEFGPIGEVQLTCPIMSSLRADAYALKAIKNHRRGNLVMSAWAQCGYCTEVQLATWNFEGNMEQLTEVMDEVKSSMQLLLNLEELSDMDITEEARKVDLARLASMFGECYHVWWLDDEMNGCVPLPQWINEPLELEMAQWVAKYNKWQTDIQERGTKGLTEARWPGQK
jgi:hypothetical protein